MAVMVGRAADIHMAVGSGTGMTAEACSLVSGTTYQINNTAKRFWDPTATWIVYDGGVPVAASGYELVYGTGKIVLKTAPGGAVTVTGAYLSPSQVAQAFKWTLTFGPNLIDSHTFGDTWEEKTAALKKGTCSFERFYNDNYFHTNASSIFLLVLYMDQAAGPRYVAVGYLDAASIEAEEQGLIKESPSFQISGWVDYAAT